MSKRLEDRVAIVVGSTSGIGRAIANAFAAEGANVVITGRRKEKGEEVVKEITDKGFDASYYQVGVSDDSSYITGQVISICGGASIV